MSVDTIEDKRVLSIAEAARYTSMSRGLIEYWLDHGLLPFEELPSTGTGAHRLRRIRRRDIDEFLDNYYTVQNEPVNEPVKESRINEVTLLPK
ncbi:helix-turn-helix domain-containing protein [candidate division KSB1 bacterium]